MSSVAAGAPAVPPGPALGDPATAQALGRYRRRGGLLVLAGLALFAVWVVVLVVNTSHASWLLHHGARTPGEVVAVGFSRSEERSITVSYLADGARRRGKIALAGGHGPYELGERLTVIYDPRHPSDIRTPQESNITNTAMLALVFGAILGLGLITAGALMLHRARTWRALLAQGAWQAYRVRELPTVKRRGLERLNPGLELLPLPPSWEPTSPATATPAATPILLQTPKMTNGRRARLHKCNNNTIWMAGDPAAKVVLAIPATHELFPAKAPSRSLHRYYAQAAATSTPDPKQGLRKLQATLLAGCLLAWITVPFILHPSPLVIAALSLYTLQAVGLVVYFDTKRRA